VPKFHATWSLDDLGRVTLAAEKAAFERTVDLIMDRWTRDPSLHVYHYAAYERTALGRLAQRHGTREEEVDRLLRGGVLVDLFRAVRQGIRASVESYSIKRIEPLPAGARDRPGTRGSSIVAFEGWLELGSDAPVEDGLRILAGIEDYNRDDVLSNWRLRDWLEERRADLEAREGERLARPVIGEGAAAPELNERQQLVADVAAALTSDDPGDPVERAARPEVAARWLLAQLLAWHRREDKSAWWRFFDLMGRTEDELIEEREPLAGLELLDSWPVRQSIVYRSRPAPPPDRRDSDIWTCTGDSAGEASRSMTSPARSTSAGPKLAGVPCPRDRSQRHRPARSFGEPPPTGQASRAGLHPESLAEPDNAAARALLLRTPPDVDSARRPALPASRPRRDGPTVRGCAISALIQPADRARRTRAWMIVALTATAGARGEEKALRQAC
jgi:hypothetical protein